VRAPSPIPALAGVRPYAVPAAAVPCDLRLDGSEGLSPPTLNLEASADLLRRYPKPAALEARLAQGFDVAPARVVMTAGADDALERVCRAFLAPGRRAILPSPTFEMLARYAALTGSALDRPTWDGAWPLDAVLAAISSDTSLIAAVSPNNPTGGVVDIDAIEQVAAAAPGAAVLVDLAYGDFADVDLLPPALTLSNAVVVGSMSKSWCLPGLRIGWAVASVEVAAVLRAAGQPYAVSAPSLALAAAALDAGSEVRDAHVAQVRVERKEIDRLLRSLGVETSSSQANFVFGRSPRAQAIRDGLAESGIAIRVWPNSPTLSDAVRITCPGETAAFARLTSALESLR
jgi:histidinol-phosphate aminotransferase